MELTNVVRCGRRAAAVAVVTAALALAGCAGPTTDSAALQALRAAAVGSRTHAVFEGKIPCADCQGVKVRLTLFEDAAGGGPTDFLLERIHVGRGDDRTVDRGRWQRTIGSPLDADGVLVRLDAAPPELAQLQRVGDVLLILDRDTRPRVGNAALSFTLSRTG